MIQYCGRLPSVLSVLYGYTISTLEGYYQNSEGFSVLWGIPSALWKKFSTAKDVEYFGRCSVLWKMFSAVKGVQNCRGIPSIQWKDTISSVEEVQYCEGC